MVVDDSDYVDGHWHLDGYGSKPACCDTNLLPEFHFVWRQLVYLIPAAGAVFILSLMTPRMIRILSLLGLCGVIGLMSLTLCVRR